MVVRTKLIRQPMNFQQMLWRDDNSNTLGNSLHRVLTSTICLQVLEGAVMKAVEAVIGSNVFDEAAWEPCLDVITNGIQG